MKTKKVFQILFASILGVGILLGSGCSSQTVKTSDQTEKTETDAPKTEFTISDSSAGLKTIYLVNNSGQNIIGLSAWPVGGVFGSETLLGSGQIINEGQQSAWKLPDYSADQSKYYIQIILEDGTNFILRDVDLASIPQDGQISVNYKDQTGYLIYKNIDNKTVDTFDWQISQKDQPYEEYIDDSDAIIGIPIDG